MQKDYYQVLGIEEQASAEEIKLAYRQLAKIHHPDQNQSPEAHDQFIAISEAYEVLKNAAARQHYDRRRKGLETDFDTIDHLAKAFARAQALARQRAEAQARRNREALAEKMAEEARWIAFARLSFRVGLGLVLFLLIDFMGARWNGPAPILQKRLHGGSRKYLMTTATDHFIVEAQEATHISPGWLLRHKRTWLMGKKIELRAASFYQPSGEPIGKETVLTPQVSIYRPFFFFPLLMAISASMIAFTRSRLSARGQFQLALLTMFCAGASLLISLLG